VAAGAPESSEDLSRARAPDASPCPVEFEHRDVSLGRVGGRVLTACDLAIDALLATREGAAPVRPSLAAQALLRDALLAREAEARRLDADPIVRGRIDRTLADALVRVAARDGFVAPGRAEIERYFTQHRSEFDRPARVHVRAIAVDHEQDARSILAALRAPDVRFEDLAVARSVLPGARRDQGDLGLVDANGGELVPPSVAAVAHGLGAFGELAQEPVRVEVAVTIPGRGRRRRTRQQVRWYVVQRLERLEAESITMESAARRVAFRLVGGAWTARVASARASLIELARTRDTVAIDPAALRRVALRIEATRGRGRVAGARRR
jgi:hypothetical protein